MILKYVEKSVQQVFNWSEFHLSEMNCYKIHTLAHAVFLPIMNFLNSLKIIFYGWLLTEYCLTFGRILKPIDMTLCLIFKLMKKSLGGATIQYVKERL